MSIKIYPEAPEELRKSLIRIESSILRPWYKKPEAWFAFIAAITGILGLFTLIQ